MNEKYRPSSGIEGETFMSHWCEGCERDRVFQESAYPYAEDGCEIIASSMAFDEDDERYPKEWCFDQFGIPCCTAFVPEGTDIPRPRCTKTEDMFG